MTNQDSAPPVSGWATKIQNALPELRNIVSYIGGVLTVLGVMNVQDVSTVTDALTHIGSDLADIAKYAGIIIGIIMPIWARQSSGVANLVKSLYRKSPGVVVVATPEIAKVTPAESSTESAVVKVNGLNGSFPSR